MKNTIFSILAVFSLVFTSCGASKQISADESTDIAKITGKKWQLIELAGKPVAGEINGKMPFLEFLPESSRYAATGGCNTMNGGYQFAKNGKISFTAGISTMMACDDMDSDRALAETFRQANSYLVNGDILTLSKGKKAALAKFKAVDNSTAFIGTWELDYIAGGKAPFNELFPDKAPTLIFEVGSKKVSGTGGCNNYGSNVDINGRNIKFTGVFSTRMACRGEGEPLYFQTLEKVNTVAADGQTLTLIIGDIAVMRFKKK